MQPMQFPFVEISGGPRDRGRQYGAFASARIARGIEHYLAQFSACGLDTASIRRHVESYLPRIRDFAPTLVEEMEGIAEGAGVEFESIVLLNARTELLHEARVVANRQREKEEPDGCTGVVILPQASATGQLIHALNWDWKAECASTSVVVRIRRDDGPDVLTFTEAGAVARAGMNADGLAVTANYIESDQDFRKPGVPLALVRRKVLEAETYAQAIGVIASTETLTSNNLILSHRDGVAIDFECAPAETFAVYPTDGMIVHANHWTSVAGLAKYKDTGILTTPDSLYRDHRVRERLLLKGGKISKADLVEALRDNFGDPWSVCRPPRPNPYGALTATVAMLVMDSTAGTMELTPLPALNTKSSTYALSGDPAMAA
nr:C45 family peptidase [Aquamicrobium sp. LC103]